MFNRVLNTPLNLVFRFTWIGLTHREQAYYWTDGINSTYKNWKPMWTYSDVQKQNLNCIVMDQEGYWYNSHCTNRYYFLCKKKLRMFHLDYFK